MHEGLYAQARRDGASERLEERGERWLAKVGEGGMDRWKWTWYEV
jgi:hypothetical protein